MTQFVLENVLLLSLMKWRMIAYGLTMEWYIEVLAIELFIVETTEI